MNSTKKLFKYIFIIFFLFELNKYSYSKDKIFKEYFLTSINNIKIIDGDTIKIGNYKIRLHGIDTPEMKQKCKNSLGVDYFCGEVAKNKLVELISRNNIKCKIHYKDKYKRLIGTCYMDKININDFLVREGWAVAYIKYSSIYIDSQKQAEKNIKGLWAGYFILPWEWRLKN